MRRDRADLARQEEGGTVPPFLRVYGWRPAAITLGFHQDDAGVDRAALAAAGIDLVRRPTGGAAVLHDDEFTYCVTGALGLPGLGRSVESIHDGIARALCASLRELGIVVERGGGGRPSGFACFAAAGGHEISVDGRKLVGSALRRGRRAFLQHGSVLRGPGHSRLGEFLRAAAERHDPLADPAWLGARTTTLEELGRRDIGAVVFARVFAGQLANRLGARAVRTGA